MKKGFDSLEWEGIQTELRGADLIRPRTSGRLAGRLAGWLAAFLDHGPFVWDDGLTGCLWPRSPLLTQQLAVGVRGVGVQRRGAYVEAPPAWSYLDSVAFLPRGTVNVQWVGVMPIVCLFVGWMYDCTDKGNFIPFFAKRRQLTNSSVHILCVGALGGCRLLVHCSSSTLGEE